MTKAGLFRMLGLLSVFALVQTACGDDEPSTCGSAELSCDCAESVCEVGSCSSVGEHKVSCVCPAC
jgi:hypothetical protein